MIGFVACSSPSVSQEVSVPMADGGPEVADLYAACGSESVVTKTPRPPQDQSVFTVTDVEPAMAVAIVIAEPTLIALTIESSGWLHDGSPWALKRSRSERYM